MRQSAKTSVMLHMQAECTFHAREADIFAAEAAGKGNPFPSSAGMELAKTPWLKPGR